MEERFCQLEFTMPFSFDRDITAIPVQLFHPVRQKKRQAGIKELI